MNKPKFSGKPGVFYDKYARHCSYCPFCGEQNSDHQYTPHATEGIFCNHFMMTCQGYKSASMIYKLGKNQKQGLLTIESSYE